MTETTAVVNLPRTARQLPNSKCETGPCSGGGLGLIRLSFLNIYFHGERPCGHYDFSKRPPAMEPQETGAPCKRLVSPHDPPLRSKQCYVTTPPPLISNTSPSHYRRCWPGRMRCSHCPPPPRPRSSRSPRQSPQLHPPRRLPRARRKCLQTPRPMGLQHQRYSRNRQPGPHHENQTLARRESSC